MINIKLKGKDKYETAENYSILLIIIGAGVFALGTGLSAVNPVGIAAIFAMLGGLISFIFTVILIIVWFIHGSKKGENVEKSA